MRARRSAFSVDGWIDAYLDGLDARLRHFWTQSLYDQLAWTPRPLRAGCRWRMNLSTLNLLRRLIPPSGDYLAPVMLGEEDLLLGLPIDLDESAEGAVLWVAEAARP